MGHGQGSEQDSQTDQSAEVEQVQQNQLRHAWWVGHNHRPLCPLAQKGTDGEKHPPRQQAPHPTEKQSGHLAGKMDHSGRWGEKPGWEGESGAGGEI